jgi:hypothetical protein
MTTRFRLDDIRLDTTEGPVQYAFPSPLTVLAGGVGVGKSTLFELVKFALGGNALIAPVAEKHVLDVSVNVTIGDARYRLVRSLDPGAQSVVRVTDLVTGDRLRDHHVNDDQPTISGLLLEALGLPTDMRAASRSGRSTKPGTRISFNDVFSFMYVSQAEMSRDIGHSQDSYWAPKRKAVFELFLGLTNPEELARRSRMAAARGELHAAEYDSSFVQSFLVESGTANKLETQLSQDQAVQHESTALDEIAHLREAMEPAIDRETQTLRDLLSEAERGLKGASNLYAVLSQQHADLTLERRRVHQDIDRLNRLEDAGARLAVIEFKVCPRCLQDVGDRHIEPHACRLCLQPDPVILEGVANQDPQERKQLAEQLEEMDDQLILGQQQLVDTQQTITDRRSLIEDLSSQIDERTADRISPRLQAFIDATERLSESRSRQRELETVLRQWDVADDLEAKAEGLRMEIKRINSDLKQAESDIASRREEIFYELNAEFADTVAGIGIPGVETATIDPLNYLPVLNGKVFDKFSPAGGIRTATQVAYWATLLTVALRRRDTNYPAFLLIDSPRTSLNDSDRLAGALYRRLVKQADVDGERLQIIIGDNELPSEYRSDYAQIDFTYERPTVSTIRHPGPDAVIRVNADRAN